MLDALADHIELPLECGILGPAKAGHYRSLRIRTGSVRLQADRTAADEYLLEVRLHRRRRCTDEAVVGREIAPSEQRLSFFVNDFFDERFDRRARGRIARQEHAARSVLADRRQRDAQVARLFA